MLSVVVIFSLFAAAIAIALVRPAMGIICFYFFYTLDPLWNWRWALPDSVPFQVWLFVASTIGAILNYGKSVYISRESKKGLLLLLGFYCACLISATQSIDPSTSNAFNSILWKQLAAVALGILCIVDLKHARILLVLTLAGIGYNSFQINLDYFETGLSRFAYRKWGSYGLDNNTMALMYAPFIPIAFGFAAVESRTWVRAAYTIPGVLLIHQVMLSMSRGAMLSVVLGLTLLLFKAPRTRANVRDFTLGLILTIALAGPNVVTEFSSIFADSDKRDNSAESRFHLWEAGIRITADYPMLGTGPNTSRYLVPKPEYWSGPKLTTSNKALHNLFLDLSAGIGIFGSLIYLSLFAIPFWHAWKTLRQFDQRTASVALAITCGIVVYFSGSMFSSGLLIESPYILVIAGFALMNDQKQTAAVTA